MKAIKYDIEEFLWILLFIIWELLFKFWKDALKIERYDYGIFTKPQLLNQFGISQSYQSLRSQRIGIINFVYKMSLQEVISKCFTMAKTLQSTIHITWIRQIVKASQSSLTCLLKQGWGCKHELFLLIIFPSKVLVNSTNAIWLMKFLIKILAFLWAICCVLATAYYYLNVSSLLYCN